METKRMELKDRSTLQERVTSVLRQGILDGVYQPGERLKQESLAEQLRVSRMPVREALRQLEDEGLIDWVRHKGAVVKEITAEDLEEIYAMRVELETLALSRSFPHLTAADTEGLEALILRMDQAIREEELEVYCRLNLSFHRLLLSRSPWKRLQSFIEQLWNGIPLKTPTFVPGQAPQSHQDHREMVAALKGKDPEKCCRVLRAHIEASGEKLVAYLQQNNSSLSDLSKSIERR
ncbi:GntR family transcriptional regulator [Kroppenstedtia eburnea]|uniref:GntR family transcriptional regulator n=1 Tax=Kroppenstedtia eburnea TaxID=714067 RepID=UPI003625BFAA